MGSGFRNGADGQLTDDELMAGLRRAAAQIDPVPDAVVQAARAAISTRDIDGELAVLLADSYSHSEPGLGGVFEQVRSRAAAQDRPRLLTFSGGGVQIDLELSPRDGLMDVIGQLTGAAPGDCALQQATADWQRLQVDDVGRFLSSGMSHGPMRVRCRSEHATVVTTAWVTV
jgi:hypothetical protein